MLKRINCKLFTIQGSELLGKSPILGVGYGLMCCQGRLWECSVEHFLEYFLIVQ